jgi:hypothetical protein
VDRWHRPGAAIASDRDEVGRERRRESFSVSEITRACGSLPSQCRCVLPEQMSSSLCSSSLEINAGIQDCRSAEAISLHGHNEAANSF